MVNNTFGGQLTVIKCYLPDVFLGNSFKCQKGSGEMATRRWIGYTY